MKKSFFYLCFLAILSSGCANNFGNEKVAAETETSIATKIQKGVTTKAQVRTLYGGPMDSSTTASGETWAYIFTRTTSGPLAFVPFSGAAGISQQGSKLTIDFDDKGIVRNYSFTSFGK